MQIEALIDPYSRRREEREANLREFFSAGERKFLVKAKVGGKIEEALRILDDLFDPSIRICVEINYQPEAAGENYRRVTAKLEELYA